MERVTTIFSDDHPPNMVREALLEAALNTPGVLHDPPPTIHLRDLKEDGAYEAMLYYDDYEIIDDIVDGYLTRAWYAANRHGVIFPYEDYRIYHSRAKEFDFGNTNPINEEDVIEKLIELETFDLDASDLEAITENVRVLRYGKGERILRAGKETGGLYVVLEGMVKKSMPDAQGRERDLGYANAGDLLGLISAIRKEDSVANAYAAKDCQIGILDENAVHRVLQNNPEFAMQIEQSIEARLKTVDAIREQHQGGIETSEKKQDSVINLKDLLKKKHRNNSAG